MPKYGQYGIPSTTLFCVTSEKKFYKLALTVLCNLFKAIKKTTTITGARKSNGKSCEFVGVWRLILVFQSIDY